MMHPEGSGMNRRCGRPKGSFFSLFDRLNAYALSASAAGVATLACSIPADAAPACKMLSVDLLGNETYAFNPADQEIAPFNIAQTFVDVSSLSLAFWNRGFFTPNLPGAEVLLGANAIPAELPAGAVIGSSAQFGKGRSYGLLFTYGPSGGGTMSRHRGNLKFSRINYLGFKIVFRGKPHYGWLRLKVTFYNGPFQTKDTRTAIQKYGWETTPGKPITAGSCSGPERSASAATLLDDGSESAASGPVASSPVASIVPQGSETPQVGSLGMLAIGAAGIPFWRRK